MEFVALSCFSDGRTANDGDRGGIQLRHSPGTTRKTSLKKDEGGVKRQRLKADRSPQWKNHDVHLLSWYFPTSTSPVQLSVREGKGSTCHSPLTPSITINNQSRTSLDPFRHRSELLHISLKNFSFQMERPVVRLSRAPGWSLLILLMTETMAVLSNITS